MAILPRSELGLKGPQSREVCSPCLFSGVSMDHVCSPLAESVHTDPAGAPSFLDRPWLALTFFFFFSKPTHSYYLTVSKGQNLGLA